MKADPNILKQIKEAVHSVDENAEVILFGSRARGDYNEESDWDVLVLSDAEENDDSYRQKIRDVLFELELTTQTVISSIVKNRVYWDEISVTPLHREVVKDGVYL